MRMMSFSITTPQFRARTKTVTRRMGWLSLHAGAEVMGVEKAMGLKPGQKVVQLGAIRILEVRREPLSMMLLERYGRIEAVLEGFPTMEPAEFVEMFCRSHNGCTPESVVTRIEFKYL